MDFEQTGPYKLRVKFDDGTEQEIDFEPVLEGTLFDSLKDERLFSQVEVDLEVHTLVWPNGADFDPATLHDWPEYADDMAKRAKRWALVQDFASTFLDLWPFSSVISPKNPESLYEMLYLAKETA